MENDVSKNRRLLYQKMDDYFDESTYSSNYLLEKENENLKLRKKKIFSTLLSKRKEAFKSNEDNFINHDLEIDITKLKCDEEIKNDVNNYIKTKFEIKSWFKYLFSSNKNENLVSLFLIRRYIELQVTEIKETEKRVLSRNNTELIQRLVDNLLSDDLKIIYNSCACLTNLMLFPSHIENRIYSEKNLEKILKFFNVLYNNISVFGYNSLGFYLNLTFNENVIIYFVKNSFLENFYNFLNNIINNKINFEKEKFELNTIVICIQILFNLLRITHIDDNYSKKFFPFISICKYITSKYYVNIDNSIFDENKSINLINIWEIFSKNRNEKELFVNEIIKDSFVKVLFLLYNKIKKIENKIIMTKIFSDLVSISDKENEILINDGIIEFLVGEIERYQYSNVKLLSNIIFACMNLGLGTLGQIEMLFKSGIIFKIIDITNFYINDKLDKELNELLVISLLCLGNIIMGGHPEVNKSIIIYNKSTIVSIFCNALKLGLDPLNRQNLIEKIIFSFYELNVVSEELEPDIEKEYDIMLINNALEELLNNLSNKKFIDNATKDSIERNIEFIKAKEKEKNL